MHLVDRANNCHRAQKRRSRLREACDVAFEPAHVRPAASPLLFLDKLSRERSGKVAERDLRSVFVAAWRDRPIGEITALDVLDIINRKKRRAPQMARALMVLIRRFFNWACDAHVYGLDRSPCDRLSVSRIIGPVPRRTRRLNDAKIFASWRATGKIRYPVGPVYRMLLLTGLRLSECAQLSWPEVQGDLITIPPAAPLGDLFFPKPFNDEQVEIVRRLEVNDGVVVQGPPGTGKTHTISNIICHYLALGRRVLVVSHGEAALSVMEGLRADVRF